jgi:hypothetical protein
MIALVQLNATEIGYNVMKGTDNLYRCKRVFSD